EEFWTSLLLIMDIPILIYKTVVSILMRSLMLPLIIASFIPHPLVKAIAAAVGYGLLAAFVQGEIVDITHKIILLKTGSTTKDQKKDAYNRVADSFIALAMTAVIILFILILHFLASVAKGVFNFVRGKVIEPPKAEAPKLAPPKEEPKIQAPKEEPKVEAPKEKPKVEGGEGEGKGKGGEAKGKMTPEGETGSVDGQRGVKITEKGDIWICASPCEKIRARYEAELKENPNLDKRLGKLEKGYSELKGKEKTARDAQIKDLEQKLADVHNAKEGVVRIPTEGKWPPKPPTGEKPPIDAPDAAEWRYKRYAYEKYAEGAKKKDILPPGEWMDRYFDPTAEGGRPGRPGGPEQVAAKKKLAGEGIKIVENVELGGRYPDGVDPKPNAKGGKSYFEVGKMLESGIPEARERVKIGDEIKAMGSKDTVTFVDKADTARRVTYNKGSTPESPSSRTFEVSE
ncbi:MAG TPA: hypothetical protein VEV87_09285, partial [Chitinophagaceae bacterium]|nr:hypothetical protein [Chitinophagaceae bacterium]